MVVFAGYVCNCEDMAFDVVLQMVYAYVDVLSQACFRPVVGDTGGTAVVGVDGCGWQVVVPIIG